MRRNLIRRALPGLLGVLAATLLGEGAASLWLGWRDATAVGMLRERAHCEYDPELGWVHRRGFVAHDLYGPGRHLTTNGQRMRAPYDYPREVPAGRGRIVCVGDSFTLGYGVGDDATWPAQLESRDTVLEAVNMGQAAYGLDQCWLWYRRDGVELECDLVLLAVIGHDFERMVAETALTKRGKPFLELVDGELRVQPPTAGNWDRSRIWPALVRLWPRTALGRAREALRPAAAPQPAPRQRPVPQRGFAPIAARVLTDFKALCDDRGQALAVLYLPTLEDLGGRERGHAAWLGGVLAEREIPFLDLTRTFARLGPSERQACFTPDRHYSQRGNELVAEQVLRRLPQWAPALASTSGELPPQGFEDDPSGSGE